MNILFFLIPKAKVDFIKDTSTLRQTVEKMCDCGFAAIPMINEEGIYIETITNGDILLHLKEHSTLDLFKAEHISIKDVKIKRPTKAIKITANMEDLMEVAKNQNFVPVVDDTNHFIGIVTRKAIINYFEDKIKETKKLGV